VHPSRARDTFLLSLLAAAAFLPCLGRPDIVTSHEARVVQTSRAMAESGWPWDARPVEVPDVKLVRDAQGILDLKPIAGAPPLKINPWLVPILNGQVRLQKPPLPYWCTATLYRLAGHWSEGLSRALPAAMGFVSTFFIAAVARMLIGRRAGLIAGLVWASTHFLADEFRKSMADPYLAFFALVAMWGWVRGTRRALLASYLAIGFGLLSKGYPLLPHLIIPLALYHILYRRRAPGRWWLHLLGIAIVMAIALPWPIYILKYVPTASEFWRYESIGRLSDNVEQYRPWYFYLPLLLQITLPWTAIWLFAWVRPFRNRQSAIGHRRSLLPVLWLALIVLFFSIFKHKKLSYLLPAIPAQVLMVTQGIVLLIAVARRRGHKSAAATMLAAHCVIIAGLALALTFLIPVTAVARPLAIVLGVIPVGIALAALPLLNRRRPRRALVVTATAAAIVLAIFLNFYHSPVENQRSPKPAVAALQRALAEDAEGTTLANELPPEATVYLPLNLPSNAGARTIYLLIDDRRNQIRPTLDYATRKLPGMQFQSVVELPIANQPRPRWKLFAFHVR
jgi:4-amino-4-deoxy-L-arabinose transferase-like glycosyltransferase